MSLSLQEQLLKAKLVSEKQVKETQKQQRKEKKKTPKGQQDLNEVKQRAQQALMEKAEKARLLNREKNSAAEKKAIQAQIRQLIELNTIKCPDGDIAFQFVVNNTIKKIIVDEQLRARLSNGQAAIVSSANGYTIVPRIIAEKISERDKSCVIFQNQSTPADSKDDDPYADYQIPDDLTW